MNREAYLEALAAIGLSPSSKATAEALGYGVRHIQKLAKGEARVPKPLAKLLKLAILIRMDAKDLANL